MGYTRAMISRKSTKALADVYAKHFRTLSKTTVYAGEVTYQLDQNKLNGFLYEETYEPWFLSLMKYVGATNLHLRNSIMEIHTGVHPRQRSLHLSWDSSGSIGQTKHRTKPAIL